MGRGKKYSAEQIVSLLRQIEVGTANGKMTPVGCHSSSQPRSGFRYNQALWLV
jgi:hypothetical protein